MVASDLELILFTIPSLFILPLCFGKLLFILIRRIQMRIDEPRYKCDYCGVVTDKPFISCSDVPNEGCSSINKGAYTFDIGNEDYCSIQCLFSAIAKALHINIQEVKLDEKS